MLQSYERAAELYQQAAAQGYAPAQAALGDLYRDGRGVSQSFEQAAELYKQATAQGHAGAQVNLGCSYIDGEGAPKDVARGFALLKQAVAGGDKDAAKVAVNNLRKLGEAVPPGAP